MPRPVKVRAGVGAICAELSVHLYVYLDHSGLQQAAQPEVLLSFVHDVDRLDSHFKLCHGDVGWTIGVHPKRGQVYHGISGHRHWY